jgi:hypothetical protein
MSRRWVPASGIALAVLWAPIAFVIPLLPDLGSAAEMAPFYRAHADLLQVVIVCVSIGYLPLLVFLGGLLERLRAEAGEGPLPWVVFASAVMFMTALNVALGLVAAAALLFDADGSQPTYELHTAGFLLAAPAAFAGVAFFTALAALCFSGAFTRWLGWLAVAGALANVGAVGGVLSLTGPLNSGNGLIGGIAVPLGMWLAWILLASLAWLREPAPPARAGAREARTSEATRS